MEHDQTIAIGGMTCAACVTRVERVLRKVAGVTAAQVNLMNGTAHIHSDAPIAFPAIATAVEKAGYEASQIADTPMHDHHDDQDALRPVLLSALFTAPLVLSMLLSPLRIPTLPGWAQALLAAPVQIWFGRGFTISAWKAAKGGAAGMDLLVALGTWAAFLLSVAGLAGLVPGAGHLYFESSALVITLVLLGRHLESRARFETGAAIRALANLRPETARVRKDGHDTDMPVASVRIGDLVIVLPGARAPVDGVITDGTGDMDESLLTGESLPVAKIQGDRVMTGAVNGNALLVVRATAIGGETVLARMVRLVEDAQSAKPAVQKLADRISAIFIPVVLGIAVLTFAGWMLAGAGVATSIINAVSVLVIACPCALGLATPAAIMAGTGVAARHGILIRDPTVLDRVSKIRTIVFDKTGTLTEGHPILVDHLATAGGDADAMLRLAASLQAGSAHPLAHALQNAVTTGTRPATNIADLPGRGVSGEVEGRHLRLGSQALLTEAGLEPGDLAAAATTWAEQGHTVSWLIESAPNPATLGVMGFADRLKPNAKAAIAALTKSGKRVVLLSGDNPGSVTRAAAEAGITETASQMTPEGKLHRIADLQKTGLVAMVGDGINDAPALASADLGIAMATGTDVAMQAAGITLMRGDLSLVAAALDIGAHIHARIWQGLGWAFVFNTIGIPLAAAGLLSPMVSGAAMAFSSLAVVVNALLLRTWRPKTT